ncbi:MAG: hypothetical protein V1493_05800 [Candidatus Diapherotrites archaeon]
MKRFADASGSEIIPGKKFFSALGEGGTVVNIGDRFLLVAGGTAGAAEKEIAFLEGLGMEVFRLPPGLAPKCQTVVNDWKRLVYIENPHIDLFINRIPGRKILVVDYNYFQDNRQLVKEIASKTGHALVVVPQAEGALFPANFLDLGKNRILMAPKARKTIRALKKLGVFVVRASNGMGSTYPRGAGIRCTANLSPETQAQINKKRKRKSGKRPVKNA